MRNNSCSLAFSFTSEDQDTTKLEMANILVKTFLNPFIGSDCWEDEFEKLCRLSEYSGIL